MAGRPAAGWLCVLAALLTTLDMPAAAQYGQIATRTESGSTFKNSLDPPFTITTGSEHQKAKRDLNIHLRTWKAESPKRNVVTFKTPRNEALNQEPNEATSSEATTMANMTDTSTMTTPHITTTGNNSPTSTPTRETSTESSSFEEEVTTIGAAPSAATTTDDSKSDLVLPELTISHSYDIATKTTPGPSSTSGMVETATEATASDSYTTKETTATEKSSVKRINSTSSNSLVIFLVFMAALTTCILFFAILYLLKVRQSEICHRSRKPSWVAKNDYQMVLESSDSLIG